MIKNEGIRIGHCSSLPIHNVMILGRERKREGKGTTTERRKKILGIKGKMKE
jgi:hypothetical protein